MRKSAFFIAGIALGVFLAKQVESNPDAKKAFDSATAKVKEFSNAVATGFKEQEAKVSNASRKASTSSTKRSPSTANRAR